MDRKYLNLQKGQILLKAGSPITVTAGEQGSYEAKYSPFSQEESQALLQGLLSEAHMEQLLESIEGELNASGALARDAAKWGLYIGSEKTVSRFLRDRLRFLDNYYSGKLPGKS